MQDLEFTLSVDEAAIIVQCMEAIGVYGIVKPLIEKIQTQAAPQLEILSQKTPGIEKAETKIKRQITSKVKSKPAKRRRN